MQCALLERSQLIDVTVDTTQDGRAIHSLSRQSGGMHAKPAVQARERGTSCMAMDGLMRGLTEGPTWHRTWTLTMGQYGQLMSTHG